MLLPCGRRQAPYTSASNPRLRGVSPQIITTNSLLLSSPPFSPTACFAPFTPQSALVAPCTIPLSLLPRRFHHIAGFSHLRTRSTSTRPREIVHADTVQLKQDRIRTNVCLSIILLGFPLLTIFFFSAHFHQRTLSYLPRFRFQLCDNNPALNCLNTVVRSVWCMPILCVVEYHILW